MATTDQYIWIYRLYCFRGYYWRWTYHRNSIIRNDFSFSRKNCLVVTEDYVMKTADVPYSAVADFLDLVFGEMDEEEWNDLEVYDDE